MPNKLTSLMLNTMKSGKKYFPNRWQDYKDAPDEMFIPHEFEDLMDWKVHNWQLHPHYYAVIRVRNKRTNKVTEYSYKQPKSFLNKLEKLKDAKDSYEITAGTDWMVSTLDSEQLKDVDFEM